MLIQTVTGILAFAGLASAGCKPRPWEIKYTATATDAIARAAATAKTSSPTSNVKGKAFDRIAIIYFENQNYDKAYGDPNFNSLAKKGITLTNYYGATHPSQPNYMAAVAGDYFGMDHDDLLHSPKNIATVIDLLESKDIAWAHYQEDMPFSGYEGYNFLNPVTGANDYVRKHNPAIMHDSVAGSEQRLSQIKNLSMVDTSNSMFHKDLEANTLPQWMFITPNMTSDGHNSGITTAGEWCRAFLDPLLNNKNFMQNTVVLVTWDESEIYAQRNNILGILLGDAIPIDLVGTEDENFYNHYSEIATVEANWDLPTLGRWDVGANVYEWVANKTGDKIRTFESDEVFQSYYWNQSYGGVFHYDDSNREIPAPNLDLDDSYSGRRILQSIKDTWADSNATTYYTDTIAPNDALNPPDGYEP